MCVPGQAGRFRQTTEPAVESSLRTDRGEVIQGTLMQLNPASFALVLVKSALIAYLAVVAFVYVVQRSLVFRPDPQRVAPERAGLFGVSEETLVTPDGEKLIAWWTKPRLDNPVMLYFHGNGGNLAVRSTRLSLFQSAGFGVLMLAGRGYSGSTGAPSELALVADAKLAFDWIVAKGIAADQIVVFGESLGTGLAVQTAASRSVRAVILDSPYTSMADVAAGRVPWLPVHWMMSDPFDSMAHIGRVRAPVLVVHGTEDDVVPYALGSKLFAAANEPKRLLTLPGVGHVAPLRDAAWPVIQAFLAKL